MRSGAGHDGRPAVMAGQSAQHQSIRPTVPSSAAVNSHRWQTCSAWRVCVRRMVWQPAVIGAREAADTRDAWDQESEVTDPMPEDGGQGGNGGQGSGQSGGQGDGGQGGQGGGSGQGGGQGGGGGGAGGGAGGSGQGSDQPLDLSDLPKAIVDALGDAGREAIRRERQTARQAQAELAEARKAQQKLKELEDAEKSDLEKAQQAVAEATKRADDAELEARRLTAALEAGLGPQMAGRLQGKTKAELDADAKELARQLNVGAGRRTSGDAGAGTGNGDTGAGDMSGWIRQAAGRG